MIARCCGGISRAPVGAHPVAKGVFLTFEGAVGSLFLSGNCALIAMLIRTLQVRCDGRKSSEAELMQ